MRAGIIVSDKASTHNGLARNFLPGASISLGIVSKRTLPGTGSAAQLAGFVCGVEALALVGLAVAYAVGLARGTEDSIARTLASIALFLAGAGLLLSMARSWRSGATWPRMATLVVNALLVPVSFSVLRGNGILVGAPVLALALAGVVGAIRAPNAEE